MKRSCQRSFDLNGSICKYNLQLIKLSDTEICNR